MFLLGLERMEKEINLVFPLRSNFCIRRKKRRRRRKRKRRRGRERRRKGTRKNNNNYHHHHPGNSETSLLTHSLNNGRWK